ncbi:hypothetical protein DLAC_11350 [Tieghemostelium lacteum]|uniref:HIT-type domain-containing protein n=1 Tax=Tieghemostelium lacteum TaxID=361077 RepID=A0A151Z3S4_TIELA|nr:hypothetical protein DLAC_11350 [Tieghemostelium lacteum]|eukprot:KYQ88609.1 hypothetical protein DLAC_11350 [Tieghemostelium lacteum]
MTNNNKINCSICFVNTSKYNCPKCKNIKYCSIECSNKHKEQTNDHKNISQNNIESNNSIENSNKPRYSGSGNINISNANLAYFKQVTEEQLKKLDDSKYIQSCITHKKLKELILEVDNKTLDYDRIDLLEQYRKNIPEFNEFILKVLTTIGTLDNLSIDNNGNLIPKQ